MKYSWYTGCFKKIDIVLDVQGVLVKLMGWLVRFYGISTIAGYLMPCHLYTYVLIIRGAFNKFLDIFVQTFKIVVDS